MHSPRDRRNTDGTLARMLQRLQAADATPTPRKTAQHDPALSVTPLRPKYDTLRSDTLRPESDTLRSDTLPPGRQAAAKYDTRALLDRVDFDRIPGQREWAELSREEDANLDRTNRHVGQYKLFLADLLPLALASAHLPDASKRVLVVVAGACPGQHWVPLIRLLLKSNLKDRIEFELYDGADMCTALKQFVASAESLGRVRFNRKLFDDKTAQRVRAMHPDAHILFLSDIRSAIHSRDTHDSADEALIQSNMRDQAKAVELMRPAYSCLKFHAPHQTAHHPLAYRPFQYLHGRPCLQAFTYKTSAECRLHVTAANIDEPRRTYDPVEFEQKMFYHNTARRPTTHTDREHEAAVWAAAESMLGIDRNVASALQRETVSRLRVYTPARPR